MRSVLGGYGRTGLAALALVAMGVAGPAAAQDLLGQGEDGPGKAVGFDSLRDPGQTMVELGQRYRVAGFDPVEDVPTMKNWMGDVDSDGAGNCYALSLLTSYFFTRAEFTPEPGLPFAQWWERKDLDVPLAMDEEGLERLPHLLARSLDDVKEHGRLRIGGYASLRDFTALDDVDAAEQEAIDEADYGRDRDRTSQAITDGQATTRAFRRWAEAAQYAMQIDASGANYLGSIVKSRLGWVPFLPLGADEVNKDGVNILRDRMREGRPTPIAMHPDSPNPEGHVVVVYEMVEYENRVVLTTYDCNYPPVDGEARPTRITVWKRDGWEYEARRFDGEQRYDYRIFTVTNPDSGRSRKFFRATSGNAEEHLERNHHLGNLVGRDRSVLQRVGGAVGFVGEVLNPF